MHIDNATILWNQPLGSSCYRIGIAVSAQYAYAVPGQFVMLRLPGQTDPLLRRPFSIHRLIESENGILQGIEILVKVVGRITRSLSFCQPGDTVDILGPLGHGFSIPPDCGRIFLAAGGIGVAPMLFLATWLFKKKFDLSRCIIFLGGRSKADILCEADFSALNLPVTITTDDGSLGDQCLITHPLELCAREQRPDIIVACGPSGMLACVAGIAEALDIPCQISLETAMACGMGACLGCAVKGKNPDARRLHACLDGPVMDSRQIDFLH
jgi:dihydroorotate dehydrogenase electron transfer subunit